MGASGTTTLNFGTFPGTAEATVDVSGQTGFVSTSEHDAWIQPIATADHSSDEHDSVDLQVRSQNLTDGTIHDVKQFVKNNARTDTYTGTIPVGESVRWGMGKIMRMRLCKAYLLPV